MRHGGARNDLRRAAREAGFAEGYLGDAQMLLAKPGNRRAPR